MKYKKDFVLQNIGGENILVPIGQQVMDLNGIITLNETAAYLWKLLSKPRTIDEMSVVLSNEYSIDKKIAKNDVQAFIEEINHLGLLDK